MGTHEVAIGTNRRLTFSFYSLKRFFFPDFFGTFATKRMKGKNHVFAQSSGIRSLPRTFRILWRSPRRHYPENGCYGRSGERNCLGNDVIPSSFSPPKIQAAAGFKTGGCSHSEETLMPEIFQSLWHFFLLKNSGTDPGLFLAREQGETKKKDGKEALKPGFPTKKPSIQPCRGCQERRDPHPSGSLHG